MTMMVFSSLVMVMLVLMLQVSQSFVTFRNSDVLTRVYDGKQLPNLTAEEMEALNRMMEQNKDLFPSYFRKRGISDSTKKSSLSDKPKLSTTTNVASSVSKSTVSEIPAAKKTNVRPLYEPNADWRHAIENPYRGVKKDNPKPKKIEVEDDMMEFDYDDLYKAMQEESSGAFINYGDTPSGKYSEAPEQHDGLYSGEVIRRNVWSKLVDHMGNSTNFQRLHKGAADVVVVYVDPHRVSDEFSFVVNQLDRLPRKALNVATVAVSFDEPNQLRKLQKKSNFVTPILSDPSRAFGNAMKCMGEDRLESAIALISVETNQVLKIWYEGNWDVLTTREMVTEELKLYRQDPNWFLEEQSGLR